MRRKTYYEKLICIVSRRFWPRGLMLFWLAFVLQINVYCVAVTRESFHWKLHFKGLLERWKCVKEILLLWVCYKVVLQLWKSLMRIKLERNFVTLFLRRICIHKVGYITYGIRARVTTLGPIWVQHVVRKHEDG